MKTKIIFVTGKKQSGKDTAVKYIQNYLADKWVLSEQFSFADSLKHFLMMHFNLTYQQCYGTNEDKNTLTNILWDNFPDHIRKEYSSDSMVRRIGNMTAREVMQVFGSDICRAICADCWANALLNQIKSMEIDYALISDARFPNELDVFQGMDVYIIRLLRNPYDDQHKSELALDNYNFNQFKNFAVIDNRNMTIDEKNIEIQKVIDAWNL